VTPANPSITLGATQQFTATGTFVDGSTLNLTNTATLSWGSSAPGVATISNTSGSQGLATTTGLGTTTIEASLGTVNGSTTLTVTPGGFISSGSLTIPREYHTATLLNNGLVLIAGGTPPVPPSAELYNPATGTSTATGSLNTARYYHTATLLNNGLVLIVGGAGSSGILASAELYNPATGTFTPTGSLNTARYYHTATLLDNGMVLIAGGFNSSLNPSYPYLASAELYNPATGTFSYTTGTLNTARYNHTATLLNNGLVLIAGGYNNHNGYLAVAELYNPATGIFSYTTGSLNTGRQLHTATLLNNGLVLIAGGIPPTPNAELYNPATGTFSYTTGPLNTARYYHTATLLNNGMVLMAGGIYNGSYLASAELYNPTTGTFSYTTGSLNTARVYHRATLLNNGMVLMAGGFNTSNGTLASTELYDPATLTPPNLVSISLSPSSPTVAIGTAQRFTATGTFSDNSTQQLASVTWSSSNSAVASITDDASNPGAAYAAAAGNATVSACTGAVCGSTTLRSAPAGPFVNLSSTSLPFGPQNVGVPSAPLTETLTNTGLSNLTISSSPPVTIGGTNPGDFAISVDNCSGATLTPSPGAGSTCTVSVTFTPTAIGSRSATLTFTDNNNGVPGSTQTVSLTGTGVSPAAASVSPTSLSFGNQVITTTSAAKSVTLTSTGAANLIISSIAITGTNASDFTKSSTTCTAASYAPGAKCTISVTFTPSILGAETASLTVTDNAANSPQTVALSGSGISPVVLSPTSLSFGNLAQGTTSTAKAVTLTNNLSTALAISSVTTSGDFAQSNTCGTSVPAKGKCTISVTFMPSIIGGETGTLTVTDTASNSPQSATLTGTGVAPVTLAPTTLAFGSVAEGNSSAGKTITVTNIQNVALTGITVTTTSADYTQTNTCGSSLAASQKCTITVTFAPSIIGADNATLSISDAASNSPQTATLTGTGVAPVTLAPTTLAFSSVVEGNSSAGKTITVTNIQNVALTGISVTTTSTDYTQTNTCGSSLAAGQKCTITVTFAPTVIAADNATLSISDSAANSPQMATLTGTGTTPVTLTPTSATYASQTVGTTSAAKVFTLTSSLTATLNNIVISPSGDFAVSTTTCGTSLASKGKCTISVVFKPTAKGTRTGTLSVSDSAGNSPQTATLTGTGK